MLARVTGPPRPRAADQVPQRLVALFVLPYLVLGLVWVLANPAMAAPDEDAHLVKALGMARFDIGAPAPATTPAGDLGAVRNASITRVVEIPARLNPAGYACFFFQPDVTSGLPAGRGGGDRGCGRRTHDARSHTRRSSTPRWAGPPASAATRRPPPGSAGSSSSPSPRSCCGSRAEHLVRWLGPRSLVGVAVLLTPMAVFCTGILNTSAADDPRRAEAWRRWSRCTPGGRSPCRRRVPS